MQENNKQIGSRVLLDEEIKLTLPTYEKLKKQIEDIRSESWHPDNDSNLQNQKTNNIGILGARGTGKTSIIKTLINELKEQNKENEQNKEKNIILPIIIPESMSESTNLMATILGLFKTEVDKIEKKHNPMNKKCWEIEENEVTKKYNELVKKFCFIQPDFKSVSIQQYTTENDYVKKSSEIYNADIEFLTYLNDFIKLLLNDYKNKTLIFIFIDDIDLSTHRCVDIVKTLLAYISHPRIVTILSGDLSTFEEALTLDFIRKEQPLDSNFIEKSFINPSLYQDDFSEKFLERKKTLTYEYLKKILPPVYRHEVKKWHLEERGNYGKSELKIVDLLNECFGKNIEKPLIFQYVDNFNDGKKSLKNLPQLFHIFDDTARGLNNVYNILLETKNIIDNIDDNIMFSQIKLVLETIVSANPFLNSYRTTLLNNVIKFGINFDSTEIHCINLKALLDQQDNILSDKGNTKNAKKIENDFTALKKFKLFVFLDFSIRLLRKFNLLEDETYLDLKIDSIIRLINVPLISGSIASMDKDIVEKTNETNEDYIKLSNKDSNFNKILKFLSNLDFVYAIIFYQYITDKNYKLIIHDDDIYNFLPIYYMLESIKNRLNCENKYIISDLIKNNESIKELFQYILSKTNSNELSTTIHYIFNKIFKNSIFKSNLFDNSKEPYKHYYYNTFADILENNKLENNKLENNKLENNKLENNIFKNNVLINLSDKKKDYIGLKNDYIERLKVIFSIDKNNLWKNEFSDNVKKYVESKLKSLLSYFNETNLEETKVDISKFKEPLNNFKDIYKGESYTNAKRLKDYIFNNNISDCEKMNLSSLDKLKTEIENLAYSRSWYGVKEAQSMLSALYKSKIILEFKDDIEGLGKKELEDLKKNDEDFYKELSMWLHIYASYTVSDMKNIYDTSSALHELNSDIYGAFNENFDSLSKEYKDILSKDIDEKILSEFENLFPGGGK